MRRVVFLRILTSFLIIAFCTGLSVRDSKGKLGVASKTEVTLGMIIEVPIDYATIQGAINAAHSGDTIYVYSGTYFENVIVNKTVNLVGQDMAWTIIDGNGTGSTITVTANGTTILGFTIRNSGPTYPNYSGINLNASNCIVSQSIIRNNQEGISIDANCSGNSIVNNSITLNAEGFILSNCFNNSITSNQITNNTSGGELGYSNNNDISGNIIANSTQSFGIGLGYASDNIICNNQIRSNYIGFSLVFETTNNHIFHNNLINNHQQTYLITFSGYNAWDDGYPSGGNFWSNYNGTDLYKGQSQNIAGSDGIGDTSLEIDAYNIDRYPLMTTATPTPTGENVTICPSPNVNMTFERVLAEGSTIAEKTLTGPSPPPGSDLVEYHVIGTTANYDGSITIKVTYNDTGMTIEQEESMRLWQCIMVVGDIDENLKVDIFDLVRLATIYGIAKPNPLYDPQCDLDDDGNIDIFDVVLLASNYGKNWSSATGWTNITIHVDVDNNSIFGVTSHLSIFGVTKG